MKRAGLWLLLGALAPAIHAAAQDEAPASAAHASDEISDEDATALGEQIESLALKGDVEALNKLVDFKTFVDRALADISVDESFWSGYLLGARLGQTSVKEFARMLVALAAVEETTVHFLHPRGTPEARTLLFRILGPRSWNYFEVRIARDAKSELRCTDWFVYAEDEWGSEVARREMLSGVTKRHPQVREKFSDRDVEIIDHFDDLAALEKAMKEHSASKALELLTNLPEDVRTLPHFELQRLIASTKAGDDVYAKARGELKAHGWTASMDLVDLGHQKKNDALVLEDLHHLDDETGGDAQIDVLVSRVLRDQGKLDDALKSLQHALAQEPTFLPAWWGSLEIKVKQDDVEGVYRDMIAMDERFHIEWSDLTKDEDYASFVASPWHARWLEHLAAKH